jgi:hypothetical protein
MKNTNCVISLSKFIIFGKSYSAQGKKKTLKGGNANVKCQCDTCVVFERTLVLQYSNINHVKNAYGAKSIFIILQRDCVYSVLRLKIEIWVFLFVQ